MLKQRETSESVIKVRIILSGTELKTKVNTSIKRSIHKSGRCDTVAVCKEHPATLNFGSLLNINEATPRLLFVMINHCICRSSVFCIEHWRELSICNRSLQR